MSFDLKLLVHDPVNVHQLFAHTRRAIGIPADHEITRPSHDKPGEKLLDSPIGGFPASMLIAYGVDGPLPGTEYHDGEDWEELPWYADPTAALISLSTGSGGAFQLYYIVDQVGAWLDAREIRWTWYDPQRDVVREGRPSRGWVEAGREQIEQTLADRAAWIARNNRTS